MGWVCFGYVYIYNNIYMVGDMVDWWKDDCYWIVKIFKIESEINEVEVSFEKINFKSVCYCKIRDSGFLCLCNYYYRSLYRFV